MSQFRRVNIFHVRRGVNAQADSLASLAASLILPSEKTLTITVRERRVLQPLREIPQAEPVNMITAEEGKEDWREPFSTTSSTEGYLKTELNGPKYEGARPSSSCGRTPIIIKRRTGGKLEPKWEGPSLIVHSPCHETPNRRSAFLSMQEIGLLR